MTIEYLDAKRVQGQLGSAGSASFDGSNDKVTAGGTASTYSFLTGNGGSDWSLACWLKPTITHQDVFFDQCNGATAGTGVSFRFNVSGSDKKVQCGLSDGSTFSFFESSAVWTDGDWQHMCVTYDSSASTMTIYRNGTNVGSSSSIPSNNGTPTHAFTIGEAGAGNDNAYEGYMSDLLLTDDILSSTEISALASGTKVSDVSPAIDNQELHYTFLTDFTDSSGQSGRNGTASGATISSSVSKFSKPDDKATLVTTFPDSLGSSADGTLVGDPAQDTTPTPPTGLGTSSFYFDGNDAINIDGAEPFSTTVGSVSLWFYNDGTSESKVICCFADTDSTAQLLFETKTNGIMCKVRSSSTTYWEIRRNSGNNGGALSTGWHHIVASQDGTAVKVYVDGTYINTDWDDDSDKSKWMLTEIDNGRIGCVNKNSSGNVDFFTGNCMEIGLWNVALTQAQVTSLYNEVDSVAVGRKATTEPTGLRAYYPLSGTTVTNDLVDYSNLPENTIFNETDTYKQYWLQTLDGVVGWYPTYYTNFNNNTGWTETTGDAVTEIGSGTLDFDYKSGTYNGKGYYDLTTVSDTAWVLRFENINFSTWTTYGAMWLGISSITAQDEANSGSSIMTRLADFGDGDDYLTIQSFNNSTTKVSGSDDRPAITTSTNYNLEIIRDGTTITTNLYTTAFTGTPLATSTDTISGTTGLRYLFVQNYYSTGAGNANRNIIGTIDGIKFFNGVTSI